MKVLIVDVDGVGLDFALRCQGHGHDTKLYMSKNKDGTRDRTGDGLVEKVPDWEKWMQWADLIFPTQNIKHVERLDYFRKLGYPIFGPSLESTRLEVDRSAGMALMKKAGIDIPPYKMFANLTACEEYCWKHGNERWVFKTLGSEEDKSLSYVCKDAADMISTIRAWKKKGLKLSGPCMLQDFIEGIEMGVSAWMGSAGFLKPRGENFEYKKLMSGNFGPNTGEMGTVMVYTDKSKLSKLVLDPMEDAMVRMGHRGDIDVNVIIDKQGKPWPLEFTARAGWPAFFIMCSQHSEPCQWMLDALQGRDTLQYSTEAHIGVLVAQPPFPYKGGDQEGAIGNPIYGVTEKNWDDIHLCAAMMGKNVELLNNVPVIKDMLVTSGSYVMCVTGCGTTIKKARKDVYALVDEIHVKNKIVRDDIGRDTINQLDELHSHGFATSLEA